MYRNFALDEVIQDKLLIYYTPALKKWGGGGILVYICPWFRPSFRPSFRNSETLFRQRYLHNRLR